MSKTSVWRLSLLILVFALVGGAIFKYQLFLHYRQTEEQKAIQAHVQFLTALDKKDYRTAYNMMSGPYRAAYSLEEFRKYALTHCYWLLPEAGWTVVYFSGDTCKIVYRSNGWLVGRVYWYTKENGRWLFSGRSAFAGMD